MSQSSDCSWDDEVWAYVHRVENEHAERLAAAANDTPEPGLEQQFDRAPAAAVGTGALEPVATVVTCEEAGAGAAAVPEETPRTPLRRSVRTSAQLADTKRNLRGVLSPQHFSNACLQQAPPPAPGVATAAGALHGRGAELGHVAFVIAHPSEEPPFYLGRTFEDVESGHGAGMVSLDPMKLIGSKSKGHSKWTVSGDRVFRLPVNRIYEETGSWYRSHQGVLIFQSDRSYEDMMIAATAERDAQQEQSLSSQQSFEATQV
jgi:hypothetical protein